MNLVAAIIMLGQTLNIAIWAACEAHERGKNLKKILPQG